MDGAQESAFVTSFSGSSYVHRSLGASDPELGRRAPRDMPLSLLALMLLSVHCFSLGLGAWLHFTEHRVFLRSQVLVRISPAFLPDRLLSKPLWLMCSR